MRVICIVALLLGCASASRTRIQLKQKDNPVAEVTTLLQDLQTQTEDEGAAEAKTYDEFACFCKDTTKEKSDAIKQNQEDIDTHTATVEEKSALRDKKKQEITDLNALIQKTTDEMNAAEAKRDAEKTKYEARAADLNLAIRSVEGAMEAVTASMPSAAGLVQVKAKLRKSMELGDLSHLNPKHQRTLAALLQEDAEDDGVPESDFESHTGDLQDTMEDLTKKEKDMLAEVQDIEDKAVESHESYMTAKTSQKETAEDDLAATTEDLNQAMEDLGQAESDLSNAKAKNADDSQYLQDLTMKCELKAREFDQRSKMRAEELTALAQALTVITETVKKKDEKANKRAFVQQQEDAPVVVPTKEAVEAPAAQDRDEDQDDDDVDDENLAFLQKGSAPARKVGALLRRAQEKHRLAAGAAAAAAAVAPVRKHDGHSAVKEKVVQLLKAKGSPSLTALAMRVNADPFVKVKSLIQDLLRKMIQEASDEASQKGWCDTNLGKARSERDNEWSEVSNLNAEVEMLEAQRDSLADDVETLGTEIAELTDSLSKMTANRQAEKEENEETIKTAKEGHAAVDEAIGILDKFYSGAKKGKVSLAQVSPVDQDSGDGGVSGAYKGNQAASEGILGMLAVIKSDFERTIKVTTADEYEAARAFAQFDTETKASISSKETEKGNKEGSHANTEAQITESMADLESHQKMLDDVLKELEELNGTCIDTGMSYEDRVAAREKEIDALKEALSILG